MRWFKHMSHSHDDEKLSMLIDEAGLEGYGFWWLICEVVSDKIDQKNVASCTYSDRKWWAICRSSARSFRKHTAILSRLALIQIQNSGDQIKIEIPNLLKYRDEYTRKSGHTPDKLLTGVRTVSGTDTETEKEIKKEKPTPPPKPKQSRHQGAPADLIKLAESYPKGGAFPGKESIQNWNRLSPEEQQQAVKNLPLFIEDERWREDNGKWIPCLKTYLGEKRFKKPPKNNGHAFEPSKTHQPGDADCLLCGGRGLYDDGRGIDVTCDCVLRRLQGGKR